MPCQLPEILFSYLPCCQKCSCIEILSTADRCDSMPSTHDEYRTCPYASLLARVSPEGTWPILPVASSALRGRKRLSRLPLALSSASAIHSPARRWHIASSRSRLLCPAFVTKISEATAAAGGLVAPASRWGLVTGRWTASAAFTLSPSGCRRRWATVCTTTKSWRNVA